MSGRMSPGRAAHPPPGILAAFIDDRLSDDQRREIEAHLIACDECLFIVGESSVFVAEEEARAVREASVEASSRGRLRRHRTS